MIVTVCIELLEKLPNILLKLQCFISLLQESTQARQEGQKALSMARQIEYEHKERLSRIQTELEALHVKQKQIAEVSRSFI